MRNDLGLIHIYCGEGKGKTTCAVGLTVRASGYGLKVLFMQFLKTGKSSELKVLSGLDGVDILETTPVTKFSFQMTDEEKEETRRISAKEIADAAKATEGGAY
ncbi:MAG TPA: cob(I)yrinic acid a,c-diamide adenosyltransferase, partial [Candidatus Avanaerovorax faecigallinarum]|nr:cob(I)yrinic acid a,c-diamide adenosyltransferase [Candidatus Avanaerovorax faecigallinarum]